MTIETTAGGTVITGNDIRFFQLASRKGALKLETLGMTRRGRSAYSICKEVYKLKGNKQSVLQQMEQLIADITNGVKTVDDLPNV